jgi:ATP-dependent Clp protease protease subunit
LNLKSYTEIDPKLRVKDISTIIDLPVVIRVGEVNLATSEKFTDLMSKAHSIGQPVIPIIVDSFGGECYSLFGILSEIENSKIPVCTIVESKAMSAGAIIFSAGTKGMRYMAPNATVLIHEVFNWAVGKSADVTEVSNHTEKLNKMIFDILAKNCGKDKNYFMDILQQKRNADWYLTARDAIKHGIADEIKVPNYKTRVSVEYIFD